MSLEVSAMDYTVQQLAALTGLTPRTLRYYDAIGLLRPGRDVGNGYRRYGPEEGAPAGGAAREACRLHRAWLEKCWGRSCPPQAQAGMGELYAQDPRFAAYYDGKVSPGCAAFFAQAIRAYCKTT